MERTKNTQIIVIVILSIAILSMSVGFALYSQTLNLNGTVEVKAASWNVHFKTADTPQDAITVSSGSEAITVSSASGTAVSWSTTLEEPGDFAEFTIDVQNEGTIDAKLISLTLGGVSTDQDKYINYVVTYDGTDYDATTSGLSIALNKSTSKTVKVKVLYDTPASENDLPSTDVNLSLTLALAYQQA